MNNKRELVESFRQEAATKAAELCALSKMVIALDENVKRLNRIADDIEFLLSAEANEYMENYENGEAAQEPEDEKTEIEIISVDEECEKLMEEAEENDAHELAAMTREEPEIEDNKKGYPAKKKKEISPMLMTPAAKKRYILEHANSMAMTEIARKLGVTYQYVHSVIKKGK